MKTDFTLPDKDGNKVSLKDFRGKWVVVYFYPKDMTPGCTIEAHEFTQALSKFKKLNCEVLGISADTEESHCNFYDKEKLKLTLLSDPNKKVIKQYNAFGKKNLYGKIFEGILRTTYLINPEGKIVESWKGVRAKGHAQKVLDKLKELSK